MQNVCYYGSNHPCIFTYTEVGLVASLPDDPDELWPIISLQIGCSETFDITSFNILPQYLQVIPDHGTVVTPSSLLAGSASFRVGQPSLFADIRACICVLDTCSKEGTILMRGVYELLNPVVCEPNTNEDCVWQLQSPNSVGLAGTDPIILRPRGSGLLTSQCSEEWDETPVSYLPTGSSVSTTALGLQVLTREYLVDVVHDVPAGDYVICYCAVESGCVTLIAFRQYAGILKVNSLIKSASIWPFSHIRISRMQFSVRLTTIANSSGSLVCALGTTGGSSPTSSAISDCSFGGCSGSARISDSTTTLGENSFHFHFNTPLTVGKYFVWCFDTAYACCTFPPSSKYALSVDIPSGGLDLVSLTGYRDTPLVFPAFPSSAGQIKLVTKDSDCHTSLPPVTIIGLTCTSAMSACTAGAGVYSNALSIYGLCFCDQISRTGVCLSWDVWGEVRVVGPSSDGEGLQYVEPAFAGSVQIEVSGSGLSLENQLGIFTGALCQRSVSENVLAPSAVADDGASQSFSLALPSATSITYQLCWCPDSFPCRIDPIPVRTVIVADKLDCQLSEWTVQSVCSAPCGSGTYLLGREVIAEPQGGGKACSSELTSKIVPCNTHACPPPVVDSMTCSALAISTGVEFFVTVAGLNLRPNDDAVVVVQAGALCGETDIAGSQIGLCNKGGGPFTTTVVCGNMTFVGTTTSAQFCYCSRSVAPDCESHTSFGISPKTPFNVPIAVPTSSPTTSPPPVSSFGIIAGLSVGFAVVVVLVAIVVFLRQKMRPSSDPTILDPIVFPNLQVQAIDDEPAAALELEILSAPSTPHFPDDPH